MDTIKTVLMNKHITSYFEMDKAKEGNFFFLKRLFFFLIMCMSVWGYVHTSAVPEEARRRQILWSLRQL